MSTRKPPPLNGGRGGRGPRRSRRRRKRRKAASTILDMLSPRRAASCLRRAARTSSSTRVVFIPYFRTYHTVVCQYDRGYSAASNGGRSFHGHRGVATTTRTFVE